MPQPESISASENLEDASPSARFIPNRMQLIIPPEQAKPLKTKARKLGKRRDAGKLKNFVDLPLDIIYETVSYLNPSELLTLGRLTKEFRALFMSRSSVAIWRRVLSYVSGLPPCPRDLTEPQYASFMFEKFCMACGSTRGSITTEYNLRLRFCAKCTRTNLVDGYLLPQRQMEMIKTCLSLVPCGNPWLDNHKDYCSTSNGFSQTYFLPELDSVAAKLCSLQSELQDYNRFIKDQQVEASRMINEGTLMQQYHFDMFDMQEEEKEEKSQSRYERIMQEIVALGWEEQYFPQFSDEEDFDQWESFLYQPKDFSTRGWNMIRPKLFAIYQRCRLLRKKEELMDRMLQQYTEFRSAQPLEQRRRMPGWGDLWNRKLPCVDSFFQENYEECDEEKLALLMEEIKQMTTDFIDDVERDLADMILRRLGGDKRTDLEKEAGTASSRNAGRTGESSTEKGKAKAIEVDPSLSASVLSKAASLFLCDCLTCANGSDHQRVTSYPYVAEHIIGDPRMNMGWIFFKPTTSDLLLRVARNVLVALGLPADCTRAEALRLGDLICRCDHPEYRGRLSFEELVEHIYYQELTFTSMCMSAQISSDPSGVIEVPFINGHSCARLRHLVRIAPETDEVSSDSDSDTSVETIQPPVFRTDIPSGHYCKYCYRLSPRNNSIRNETAAYHMKYSHGRESEPDDFQAIDILLTTPNGFDMVVWR